MQKIIYHKVGEATPEKDDSVLVAILKVIFFFIVLPLMFYFIFIRTPRADAQVIPQSQVVVTNTMTIQEKRELLVRLIALLNQLLNQLQEIKQQKIMTDTPVTFGSVESVAPVVINRFLIRANRDVVIESTGEIDLNSVRFFVGEKELPTRLLVVSPEKQGSIFVYTTSLDVPLYEVSGQKEGADQNGPAFAQFTVHVGNLVSKEALQNKSGGYETAVQF